MGSPTWLRPRRRPGPPLPLEDGARIAVIGGGPAGSFFSYFVLDLAARIGVDLRVDLYEPRDYTRPAPHGCNMCGGIVSESLVQHLAAEGINLPPSLIERGIDSYALHTDVGSVRLTTPNHEMRIGAVYRGAGPRDVGQGNPSRSFDGHLQTLAARRGANIIRQRVEHVVRTDGEIAVQCRGEEPVPYDLVTVAVGVNAVTKNMFQGLPMHYRPPRSTKTHISEFRMGEGTVTRSVGSSMHVYLLNIPRLEFACVVPKGEYATVCLLGEGIDQPLIERFRDAGPVRARLPSAETRSCHCSPRIAIRGALRPFDDRIVFVGDCGVTRLYKDGIGAAYRTAKAAATTAVFEGVSAADFERHYWPACRSIARDNAIGGALFAATRLLQKTPFAQRAVLRMVEREQRDRREPRMSSILWDLFSGSAPYRDILTRALHPAFLAGWIAALASSVFSPSTTAALEDGTP